MPQESTLTADEKKLNDVWNEHLRAEFSAHSPDETMATMVSHPRNYLVPLTMGGNDKEGVHDFYARHFLPQIPPDLEIVPVSRTIGQGRLVDEIIIRFTHTIPMDWIFPGIPPTGKRVETALVVIVQFDGDKMLGEHIYWDQASMLVQLGLLEREGLPVVGAEGARGLLDQNMPLNELIHRTEHAGAGRQ